MAGTKPAKRGAWGQEWARGHGAMGPWGYGAAEGASMHWGPFMGHDLEAERAGGGKGPFKVSLSREGHGTREHGAMGL